MHYATELSILLHAAIAAILAGLVGLERELGHKPAGLRTNMVIGAVAALFVLLGKVAVALYYSELPGQVNINTDPIRMFEAIVLGVSFIGAGTIMRSPRGGGIHGLTTAASLLVSAGIGIAVGLHLYLVAVGMAVLAWLIMRLLRRMERSVLHDDESK